jgi:hypothetical protein
MANTEDPVVDQWYQQLDKDVQFKVTSIEDGAGIVEVQYLDGETQEMDLDDWYELEVEAIDEPEEWSDDEDDEDWAEEDEEEVEDDEESLDEWDDDYEDDDSSGDWGKDY